MECININRLFPLCSEEPLLSNAQIATLSRLLTHQGTRLPLPPPFQQDILTSGNLYLTISGPKPTLVLEGELCHRPLI